MKMIHIVGRQNSGKTTLIVELIKELSNRGLRIGTIKHTTNEYELDQPGKDSHLHREAGSSCAAIVTANQMALFLPRNIEDDPLEKLKPFFLEFDLTIIEGYINGPGKKIEVWRESNEVDPILSERNDIKAVITDDSLQTKIPIWPRNDIKAIADNICKLIKV